MSVECFYWSGHRAANSFQVVDREWFAKRSPNCAPTHASKIIQRLLASQEQTLALSRLEGSSITNAVIALLAPAQTAFCIDQHWPPQHARIQT